MCAIFCRRLVKQSLSATKLASGSSTTKRESFVVTGAAPEPIATTIGH